MSIANNSRADAPQSALRRGFGWLLTAWLLLSGAALLHTSLATIRSFAWPQPTYDQFRLYPIYLEQPFPQSVLQLENQHRPVFPGLVRVAEIEWRDADQQLQIAFGVACALLTALTIALASLRERGLELTARAAGASAAVIAVFWLGNARMLLHGNELVHAYLLTLAVVGGAYGAWRAGRDAPWRWLAFASGAAAVATFSFGPGIALFPALLVVAWLQRVPLRTLLLPIGVCTVCLILYVWVLPGDQGVRGVLELRPWESFSTAARWIASPWVHAWLGFADPPLNASMRSFSPKGRINGY